MGNGKWTRWGRGSCEGYSFDIGYMLRGQAMRNADGLWHASLNTMDLGRAFETKEAAQSAVVERITKEVKLILADWSRYQDAQEGA